MTAECPKCHAENREDSRFCGNCASPLRALGPEAPSLTKTLETPVHVIRPGTVVAGKYRIIEELGHGGMGIVYKAEDIKLKRFVALKFLPPHLLDSPDLKERFLIEAQAAAALNHPNICVIHEVGEDESCPYIAMEFVDGETLKDRLRKGPLTASEALTIAGQVAAGLGEAHHKDIIHRDVKSANIMITAKGQTKVMDFGLAKLRGGSSLTRTQTTIGTVAYMSPEQARGQDLDPRTDIWSLGVVLYEMLSGKLPFRGDHDQAVIHQIVHAEPDPLKKARPDTPPGVEEIVGQALAKKPADRYRTMEELHEDLEAVAEGLKPLKARPRRAARKILGIKAAYLYAAVPIVLALLLGLNVGGIRNRILGKAAAAPAAIRLAVLPFENLSGDPQQDYFSDGMTQEMIAQLGRLHPETLNVIARSSVMRYKDSKTPVDQIGRELNVEYVLEGSAQREGTRVRITAELIKVRDQSQLWSDSYEREMSDILALQNDVAKNVAKALALKLLPSEQASLAKARPVNPEAYVACLNGMSHWYKLTPADLDTARKYFESALEKDPDYALAHTGMFLALLARAQMGLAPPRDVVREAKPHLLRALELDDTLPEAQFAMAGLKVWYEWDWQGGEASFRRAIELNPNDAMARVYYSNLLFYVDRPEEALAQGQRALELDPLNSLFMGMYSVTLLSLGRYDEAIALDRKVLRTSPNDPIAHSTLWEAFHLEGKLDEALEEAKAYYAGLDLAPVVEAMSAGSKTGGYSGAMRAAAETLVAISQQVYFGPWMIAYPYAAAGDKDKALEWLEKGIEVRDLMMPYLGQPHSILKDLFGTDPRFEDLLRKMNLPLTAGKTR